ncbi:MAG: outer rane adhesin like protein, partial [Planctomycetaceae bacterium]|nr:outer rane adhesin like protein [Planctomycetaceae bacterium]
MSRNGLYIGSAIELNTSRHPLGHFATIFHSQRALIDPRGEAGTVPLSILVGSISDREISMLRSIRWSELWSHLSHRTLSRRRPITRTSRITQIEALESRLLLTGLATVDSYAETYRDFNFNVTGSFGGSTTIPNGYFDGTQHVDYHDSYSGSLISGQGTAQFSSPSDGTTSGSVEAHISGEDNSGSYDYVDSAGVSGEVHNGELSNFSNFPIDPGTFAISGNFNVSTWGVNVSWTGNPSGGISTGGFLGSVNQDDQPKTDFNANVVFDTSDADAIHDSDHSINDVASKVKAMVTIDVTGQLMHAPSMATAATHAHIYLGDPSLGQELTDPIDIHWNTGTIALKLSDFLGKGTDVGDGKIHVVFDKENAVDEADETNNDQSFVIDCYDLVAVGMNWAPDGSAYALFSVGVGGLNNGGLGATSLTIYYADANGNRLDATPATPNLIDPLSIELIDGIDIPTTTDGEFLLPTLPLTWRPDGATQLIAEIDDIIPPNVEVTKANNVAPLPLSEITVSGSHWNNDGSVDVGVHVAQLPLQYDTSVSLYWGEGAPGNFTSLTKISDVALPKDTIGDVTLNVSAADLGTPPLSTESLVVIADPPQPGLPFGKILEPDENNTFLLPLNPVDQEFDADQDLPLINVLTPLGTHAGTFVAVSGQGPQHGNLQLQTNGVFTYTPDNHYLGDDTFQFYLHGTAGDSLPATVTIHVLQRPIANAHSYTLTQDTQLNNHVTGTDPQQLALTFAVVQQPAHGGVQFQTNGTFTYTPTAGYSGPDSFTFTAADGVGISAPAKITLQINPSNLPPVADANSFTLTQDSHVSGQLTGSDPEQHVVTFAVAQQPSHGNVQIQTNGAFTYTPTAGYSGPDSFTFTDNDGNSDSPPATISLQINAINLPPVAHANSFTLTQDSHVSGQLTGSDPEQHAVTFAVAQQPSHGNVQIQTNGTFTYTPTAGYSGADSFTFTDNNGNSDSTP